MYSGLQALLADHSLQDALDRFIDAWAVILEGSDFQAGCLILAAAVEGDHVGPGRDAAAAAFRRLEDLLAEHGIRAGISADRAQDLGALVIAAVEGAVVISRAQRSVDPLRRTQRQLRLAITSTLAT